MLIAVNRMARCKSNFSHDLKKWTLYPIPSNLYCPHAFPLWIVVVEVSVPAAAVVAEVAVAVVVVGC